MELSKKTKEYWEEKDWQDLENSKSIKDLYDIALRIINRMPKPFSQVCGPISTGGLGDFESNLNVFNNTIISLQDKGLNVFDQMPFEHKMKVIKESFPKKDYHDDIINDFYLPFFESGLVTTFYFIPDWQSSRGAQMEHALAEKLGIEIKYL